MMKNAFLNRSWIHEKQLLLFVFCIQSNRSPWLPSSLRKKNAFWGEIFRVDFSREKFPGVFPGGNFRGNFPKLKFLHFRQLLGSFCSHFEVGLIDCFAGPRPSNVIPKIPRALRVWI